ncbi:methyltransferase domain-containing protein [Thalassobellus suaedae]|uniref:Methyltransferase domain-containing protein n=1 Tax=Thalassobellus suaedae TaxID=3074124 RepID=A0ABY9XUY5_9FLAO|nr:methyltransferase domain-containing protein [Flavobacteriaceae bacterium HL-DH14]
MKNLETYKNRAKFANSMLEKYFPKAPNTIVSDIGAGFGHMKKSVNDLGGTWQPFDYVKKIEESIFWNLNNEAPSTVKKFGTVIFLEVLEHLDNPLLGFQNISNHMLPDSIIILTTPNPQSSKNILSLFLRGSLYAFQEKHLKENHVFTPWKHVVEDYLKRCGFDILEYAIVDTHYKEHKPNSIKDWIKQKAENYLEYRNPLAKGMSYGMVAKKV